MGNEPIKIIPFGKFQAAIFEYRHTESNRYKINIRKPLPPGELSKHSNPNPDSLLLFEEDPLNVYEVLKASAKWILEAKISGEKIETRSNNIAKIITYGKFSSGIFYYVDSHRFSVNIRPISDESTDSIFLLEEEIMTAAYLLKAINGWILNEKVNGND